MKKTLSLIFILFSFSCFAQQNDIEIIQQKSKDSVVLIVKNNADVEYSVTVDITLTNAKMTVENPISTKVLGKSEVEITTIKPSNGGQWKYSLSYTYSKSTGLTLQKNKIDYEFDFNTLYVFTQVGCNRCKFTIDYLEKENLNFKQLNTSDNAENNKLMWNVLARSDFNASTVSMPVIVYQEKTYYSIKDLNSFLETLK